MPTTSQSSPWATNPYLQGATGSTTTTPTNPFTTVSNTKNTEIDSRLKSLLDIFDQANKTGASAITDYTKAVTDATPKVTTQTDSDLGALDALFNGQTAAELAAIRAKRKAAMGGVVNRSMGDLRRLMGTSQLALGGGGRGLGTGSFMARLGLDKAADINARAEADDAAAERGDFEDILNRRLASVGGRQKLTDQLAGRTLMPYLAENQRLGAASGALGTLLQQDLLNKFYGLRGEPEEFAT